MLLLAELKKIQAEQNVDLGIPEDSPQVIADYFPQFEMDLRSEAAAMARHYELFYCLERTIRRLIAEILQSAKGDTWWKSGAIPVAIHTEVAQRMKREIDSGITPRSTEPLDYTTFGELGDIIKSNWNDFGGIFSSQKAVERIMSNLNTLRNPIAHCCPLAEDEVLRLQLSLKDWFRIME
jgi:hypothetical protein